MLVDDASNVYTLGLGDRGQLGHNSCSNEARPRKIEKFQQIMESPEGVKQLVGSSQAFRVNDVKSVFSHGHTKLPAHAMLSLSFSASRPKESSVRQVCCGKDFTLLLTEAGRSVHGTAVQCIATLHSQYKFHVTF